MCCFFLIWFFWFFVFWFVFDLLYKGYVKFYDYFNFFCDFFLFDFLRRLVFENVGYGIFVECEREFGDFFLLVVIEFFFDYVGWIFV